MNNLTNSIVTAQCRARVNPSGRLPLTFPASDAQLPRPVQIDPDTTTSNPATPRKGGIIPIDYDIEGADVGYRWFEREHLPPLFPFDYGLSYTRFATSNLQVTVGAQYKATVDVANLGARDGALVVQIYVAKPGPGGFVKRLAGFANTPLAAGQRAAVEIALEPRIFARYATTGATTGSKIAPGTYRLWAAQHAHDEATFQEVVVFY